MLVLQYRFQILTTFSIQDIFDGKADLQVLCTEEVMGKMINKEIQPQQAFMKGMLKIKGKMNLAMKLTAVLAATRKKLPTSKL
jgi:putative sterol carrier protein